jgi:hypothetical protein
MTKNPPKPNFFEILIDFNNTLWNGWATFCFFPLRKNLLNSISFVQITTWNTLVDRFLQLQVAAVRPSLEPFFVQPPPLAEVSAQAILEDIRKSAENSLPFHTEFDTLIYPWHDAEKPVVAREQSIYTDFPKVA